MAYPRLLSRLPKVGSPPFIQRLALSSSAAESASSSQNFDIYAACCLQRFPVITPPLNELEVRAKEMFRNMEIRKSLLSEHEVRHRNDQALLKKRAKAAAADPSGVSTVVESGPFITALEAEDMWEAEKNRFKFGSRTTEADEKNDTTSTKRCLDKKLVFVVEQKIGNDFRLMLPQLKWQKGESLRQTAERALTSVLPAANPAQNASSPFPPLVQFVGNAPAAHYSYRYPKALRQKLNSVGAKVFFFKAHLLDWQIALTLNADQAQFRGHQWLTKEELSKALSKDYARSFAPIILDF